MVTRTEVIVDYRIDRLWLRVTLRAAELGLTITQLAARMGIHRTRLLKACEQRAVSRAWFERLSEALEMPSILAWGTELAPVPNVSPEKMRKALRRKLQ